MKKLSHCIIFFFIFVDVLLLGAILFNGKNFELLNPKGIIALQERNLLLLAISIMFIGVIPVFMMLVYVVTKFRADKSNNTYTPDWDNDTRLQIIFWAFLISIMCVLSVLTWTSAHRLDPHIPLVSNVKPVTIQVVALRWKWLFIYPELGIASVNKVVFPEKTPLNFELTASDTPMNSFWIPQLGGQIYAMSGMATQTHYMADSIGEYHGSNAEINGAGFADMRFTAQSVSQSHFSEWVTNVKQLSHPLTYEIFSSLSQPSENNPVVYYSPTENNLYTTIVMKYMAHPSVSPSLYHSSSSDQPMQGM